MNTAYVDPAREPAHALIPANTQAVPSAVAWPAIFAGALTAAALALLLFMLGLGLGLSSISVWSGRGADGETIGWAAIIWLAVTQLGSAGVGGYMAGRLRTKWTDAHADEVYFRDTAHGFLSWAFATMLMVSIAGTTIGAAISSTAKAADAVLDASAQVLGQTGSATGPGSDLNYWVNSLLRSGSEPGQARAIAEDAKDITVVLGRAVRTGTLPDADAGYIGQLIAHRANISQMEAKQRVQRAYTELQTQVTKVKEASEKARKATAYSMLWMFVVLLIGAFVGSFAATLGGRQRDAAPKILNP